MAKYCTKCGTQLNDNIKFCPNCGTATAAPAPAQQKVTQYTAPVYRLRELRNKKSSGRQPLQKMRSAAAEIRRRCI
ncbi:MAG: zinc ribbon domain-containing protein [Clostridia bacterium]|nr:zinc ribbon domain-containing protein [Clostridia bacterium]